MRLYYQLININGQPLSGTVEFVSLTPTPNVSQFLDAVKDKCADKLSTVGASDLLVYENKEAFAKKKPDNNNLDPSCILKSLGKRNADPLIVAVQTSTESYPSIPYERTFNVYLIIFYRIKILIIGCER